VFRGATKITLDAKGRLAIPARYRERIIARCEGHLVCTIDQDKCLLLYPVSDWEDIERQLMRLPSLNKAARKLQRLMVGYAADLELDGHGRILIPRELREYAELDRQSILIGQGNKFELWDEAFWNAKRDIWLTEGGDEGLELPPELESFSL